MLRNRGIVKGKRNIQFQKIKKLFLAKKMEYGYGVSVFSKEDRIYGCVFNKKHKKETMSRIMKYEINLPP